MNIVNVIWTIFFFLQSTPQQHNFLQTLRILLPIDDWWQWVTTSADGWRNNHHVTLNVVLRHSVLTIQPPAVAPTSARRMVPIFLLLVAPFWPTPWSITTPHKSAGISGSSSDGRVLISSDVDDTDSAIWIPVVNKVIDGINRVRLPRQGRRRFDFRGTVDQDCGISATIDGTLSYRLTTCTAVAVLIFHLSRYMRCKYRVLTATICAAQSKSPTVIGSRTSGER